MNHHQMARAPERAIGTAHRAWHEAAWRAGDLARTAQSRWRQMGKWEVTGALTCTAGLLCLPLFPAPDMSGAAHAFCTGEFALMAAGGAVTWAVARARRAWHGDGTPGRER